MRPLHLTALILKAELLTVSLDGTTVCCNFDEYRVNRCARNQTALKWAQNQTGTCVTKMQAVNPSCFVLRSTVYIVMEVSYPSGRGPGYSGPIRRGLFIAGPLR